MNSKNGKTSDPHRLLLNLIDEIDLRRKYKYIDLSNVSIYYTWKNITKSHKNNKFKISALTWNEEFELPDGSYSISDIQGYFEYIFKKHGEKEYTSGLKSKLDVILNFSLLKQLNYLEVLKVK